MRFRRLSSDAWEIHAIHPLFAGLLAELPGVAAEHDKARDRLYPDPTGDDGTEDLRDDWREHVQPDLERLFASSREIVLRDIAPLENGRRSGKVVIPQGHLDAWINVLNQARLVTVESHGLTERDLERREPPDLTNPQGLALLRVHFYAHVQELLVEAAS